MSVAHWRNSYKPVKFFFMDVRVGVVVVLTLLHLAWYTILLDIVVIGIGIASLPREVVQDHAASDMLRIVDCEWHPSDLRFTASYASEPSNPVAERAAKLADCIAHAFAARIGQAQPAD